VEGGPWVVRRTLVTATMIVALLPTSLFAQALGADLLDNFPELRLLMQRVQLTPFAQVGFQFMGANLTLPISAEQVINPAGSLEVGSLDVALSNGNFWSGALGVNARVAKKASLFLAAGGIAPRNVVFPGSIPVTLGPASVSADVEFTGSEVESWFVQAGGGFGYFVVGFYFDHFASALNNPRTRGRPLANQTLRGDLLLKTRIPFVGVQIPGPNFSASVLYSPVAFTECELALRNSQGTLTDLSYSWDKPGQWLSLTFQYNHPLSDSTFFGVWATYNWMSVTGSGSLEFVNTTPSITRGKSSTASLGRYIMGAGFSLSVIF
jgi:hypothetical protein